jgi:serine phosphatase RsbU (regulator of sigma subunit)/catechol 2,3-dioxygenase-like lactoylglutathione lyase family enzyme
VPLNPKPNAESEAGSDGITFVEHGIRHSFQYEGAALGPDREGIFLRLNFVSVYVSDQERSKRFFLDQLGFRALIDVSFPSGYRWVEVAPPDGSARLALVRPAPGFMENAQPGQSSLITFMTEDVTAKYREWSERGVKFSLPPHTPEWGGTFCRFEDVDGNPFGLAGFNDLARALESRREEEARRREAERLTRQELAIAGQVQTRLLPQRLPVNPAMDCAGICVQTRAVGGDYYDFLEVGMGRIAIVVSDIAGKGIAAALLMANLQAALRSQSAQIAGHAEQALSMVNRILFDNTEPAAYATLFLAEYDSHTGKLRYANCGHLPGLLLRRDRVEKLDSANTVIGLFEQWECAVSETAMAEDDILVLYTDGVTEAFNDSEEEFGECRLIDVISKNRGLPARQLAEAIVSHVTSFAGDRQYDDMTVVVAKKIA